MSKSEDIWDWSPRHIRLRYELFLSAITVFVIGHFDVVKFKLSPFEFENIQTHELEYYALIAATCAYVFLTITFWVRSHYEFTINDNILEDVTSELSKISYAVDSINDSKMQDILDKVSELQSFFNTEGEADNELKKEIGKLLDKVTRFIVLINRLPDDNREAFLKYLDDEIPNKTLSKSGEKSSLNGLFMSANALQNQYANREENQENYKVAVRDLHEKFNEINVVLLSQLNENFHKNAEVVKKLRRDIRLKLSFPILIQKYGMSLIVPYITSLLIFASGWCKYNSLT